MDGLIEKATELGVATIQPLVCARSVLRVAGERAERKAAHWRAVAVAACEQCGRNTVPEVAPPLEFFDWLGRSDPAAADRWLLSLDESARWPPGRPIGRVVSVLSGPEGGLSSAEQAAARAAGYQPLSLGSRVLRADTAPLAALAWVALEPV
jgi:16S rRNA (uracil1498-N3)-methyltransferase